MKGVFKNIDMTRKFGFIHGEDGNDYFFHTTGLDTSEVAHQFAELQVGQACTFEPTETPKGHRAELVKPR